MAKLVAKKLGAAALVVYVAVTLNFVLFRLAPGSPINNFAKVTRGSEEMRQSLISQFGLDQSLWVQYWKYIGQLLQGNLGISYATSQPVSDDLLTALVNTLPVVALGTLIGIGLGVTAGVVAAWRRGTLTDGASTFTALLSLAIPTQALALGLILVFAGTLPVSGMRDDFLIGASWSEQAIDMLRHMLLPATALGLATFGNFMLITRSAVAETLGEDYVLLARAKGLRARPVLVRYGLRNALLPVVALSALTVGSIVGGAVLVETVFSWPGIGRATYEAVIERDYPMLQGAFLLLTVAVVLCNLVAELLYMRLDPRIRP